MAEMSNQAGWLPWNPAWGARPEPWWSTPDGRAAHDAEVAARAKVEGLRDLLAGIKTHNDGPITPKALRWAATHEALCRSWIFDVLTGLADRADALAASQGAGESGEGER